MEYDKKIYQKIASEIKINFLTDDYEKNIYKNIVFDKIVNVYIDTAIKDKTLPVNFSNLINEFCKIITDFDEIMSDYNINKSYIWENKDIKILQKDDDEERSFNYLKKIASEYIQKKYLHNNYIDWLLLDALIYLDTKSSVRYIVSSNFGYSMSPQLAYTMCNQNSFLYIILSFVFGVINFLSSFIAPIGAVYAYKNGYEYISYFLIAWFGWSLFAYIYSYSTKQKLKIRLKTIMTKKIELYSQLKNKLVSPSNMKRLILELSANDANIDPIIIIMIDKIYNKNQLIFEYN